MQTSLPWASVIPFVTLLLCIAVLPLVPATHDWWEKNRNRLLLSLVLGIPVAGYVWGALGPTPVVHALVEYGQFIALLLSLFVITGGIHLTGDLEATPRTNTSFLAIGGAIASFIGTTGAAMLLIRPLLRTNSERRHTTHTVVFFIFIVANCGGLLTPLGDPPLFLGMLRGVPFTWTFSLFPEWLFVNALLLVSYYALDRAWHRREDPADLALDKTQREPVRMMGKAHLLLLGAVVAAVAFAPSLDLHALDTGQGPWHAFVPWRELIMLGAAGTSLVLGPREARTRNEFSWGPILEVAAVFIGIFLTMIPALRVLADVAPHLPLSDLSFFVLTGGLSAFLDNAPTYATFFDMAQALPAPPGAELVAGVQVSYLRAISLGAVLCGALTYIGNGPNFMVRTVAVHGGVPMPSFGGYIVQAARHLLPVLVIMCLIFITPGLWTTVAGVVLTVLFLLNIWRISRVNPGTAGV